MPFTRTRTRTRREMSGRTPLYTSRPTELVRAAHDLESLDGLEQKPTPRARLAELGLIFGWWTIYGIFMTGQQLAFFAAQRIPVTIGDAASRAFLGAGVWALITLLAFELARRFPLDHGPRALSVAVHTVAGVVLAFVDVVISYGVGVAANWLVEGDRFIDVFVRGFPPNLFYYWLLVGVGHGFGFHRRYRQREADAAKLHARLAQAELHLLKSQLNPHFLFNTLHAISTLMHRDVKAADRMLARLSYLLRAALDYTGTQEVSLEEELAFLEPYLEIERARLGDRLSFALDVQPNVLDARVPHMILQPLVENAIRHGIAPRAVPGHIWVSARGRRNMLDLEVLDDGRGVPPGRSMNGGLGLRITRARLEQLYGENFSFEPHNEAAGGFRVSITIPFRPNAGGAERSETE